MDYYVTVESNVRISIEDLDSDEDKTILFVHGWPGNHNLFEYQFNRLPKLGYRYIAINCRGFGLSDKPWNDYDCDRLTDDIRTVIDALQLGDITLAGYSTSGAICLRYIARYNGHGASKSVLFAATAPSLIQRPNFPYGLQRKVILDTIQGTYTDRPKVLMSLDNMVFFHCIGKPIRSWIFRLELQAAS